MRRSLRRRPCRRGLRRRRTARGRFYGARSRRGDYTIIPWRRTAAWAGEGRRARVCFPRRRLRRARRARIRVFGPASGAGRPDVANGRRAGARGLRRRAAAGKSRARRAPALRAAGPRDVVRSRAARARRPGERRRRTRRLRESGRRARAARGRGPVGRIAAIRPHGRRRRVLDCVRGRPAAERGLRVGDDPAAARREPRHLARGAPDDGRLRRTRRRRARGPLEGRPG
mmetsp:Transcript_16575/g.51590  ORF Transcript_16575/g.51590 Transcript_16575/m.51590 type:complete len:229 (+) Transcript_16575:2404-3090(+)